MNILIMKSPKLWINSTLFTLNETLYKQTNRLTMGSHVSQILVNLFLLHIESNIFDNNNKPRIGLRYVDDTFVVIKKTHLRCFSKLMITFSSHIKFTYENESEHSELPFLNCLVKRNLSGTVNLNIYRKPRQSNPYINFNSAHPFRAKIPLGEKTKLLHLKWTDKKNESVLLTFYN